MNVDAAAFDIDGACSAVIRDCSGGFIGRFTKKFHCAHDSSLPEFLAISQKSNFVVKSNYFRVVPWLRKFELC